MKRKQQEEAPPERPQFFRILLPGFSQRLTIPRPFNKYIDGEIQKKATVVSPLGKPWPVEIHGTANLYYFGEGWKEFSQAHDLNIGFFLLFRYEGEMVFSVLVFDQTTCMKVYSPFGMGSTIGDNICYHVDMVEPSESPRQETSLADVSPVEMAKSVDSPNQNVDLTSGCTEGSQFEIKITSVNPCEAPYLSLPGDISKYISEENNTLDALLIHPGRHWHVKVCKDSKGFYFSDGWQRFAEAHKLRRGDSLLFKHKGALIFDVTIFGSGICGTEHNLDAVIGLSTGLAKPQICYCRRRVAEAMEAKTDKRCSVESGGLIARNRNIKAPNLVDRSVKTPHFQVVIDLTRHCCTYRLEIPAKFRASIGLTSIEELFLRDPNGQLWPTRVTRRKGRQTRFIIHTGWREFCVGNNLKDGDVCLFELKEKNQLHVQIQRRRTLEYSTKCLKGACWELDRSLCQLTAAELVKSEAYCRLGRSAKIKNQDQKVAASAGAFIPGLQFTCTIFQTNLLPGGCLNIPQAFMSSVDLSSVRRIMLLDPRGRWWPVSVYHHLVRGSTRIGAGWKALCTSNNVEVGDKCIFRLASKDKNHVFHVNIVKREACLAIEGKA